MDLSAANEADWAVLDFLEKRDHDFLMQAAAAGAAEVALGCLAAKQAKAKPVREFAARMVSEHSEANADLRRLAGRRGITIGGGPGGDKQRMIAMLERLHGTQFDREYLKREQEDHGRAVDLYRKEALDGGDEELKRFAANVLPALEEHKKLADDLAGQVGERP